MAESPAKPAKLPAAVANASQEELQKMVVDLLKKLKGKDKKLQEMDSQASEQHRAQQLAAVQEQLQRCKEDAEQRHQVAMEKHAAESNAAQQQLEDQVQRLSGALQDAQQDVETLQKQLNGKDVLLQQWQQEIHAIQHAHGEAVDTLQGQLAESTAALRSSQERVGLLEKELQDALDKQQHNGTQEIQDNMSLYEEQLATMRLQLEEQTAATIALQDKLQSAEQTFVTLQDKLTATAAELQAVQEQHQQATAALEASSAEVVQLKQRGEEQAAIDGQGDAAQQPHKEAHVATLQAELDAAAATIERLEARALAAESSVESNVDKWTQLLQEREQHIVVLEAAVTEARQRAEESEGKAKEQVVAADTEVAVLRKELEAKEAALQEASSRESSLTEQLAGITERSAQLGELPVLKNALETAKSDMAALKKEHEVEREKVKKAIQEMKRKMDRAIKDKQRAEASAVQAQGSAAASQEAAQAEVATTRERLVAREEAMRRVEDELKEYKARATALLNVKDHELKQARAGHMEARTVEITDLQKRLAEAQKARDDAEQALQEAQQTYQAEAADAALQHDGQLRSLQDELQAQQDAAETARRSLEQWKRKHESLVAEHAAVKQPMEALRAACDKAQQEAVTAAAALAAVKAEYDTFRETSLRLAEAKDAEVARLLELNALLRSDAGLHRSGSVFGLMGEDGIPTSRVSGAFDGVLGHLDGLRSMQHADSLGAADEQGSVMGRRSVGPSISEVGDLELDSEARMLRMAERQAAKDKQLADAMQRVRGLELEVAELEKECELHQQQEHALKEALRDVERERKREETAQSGVDMAYLKNVMLKLFETDQKEALLPVVAMIMQFSPAEVQRCRTVIEAEKAAVELAGQSSGLLTDSASGDVTAYLSSFAKLLG